MSKKKKNKMLGLVHGTSGRFCLILGIHSMFERESSHPGENYTGYSQQREQIFYKTSYFYVMYTRLNLAP